MVYVVSSTCVSNLMMAKSKYPKHVVDLETLVILTIQLCYDWYILCINCYFMFNTHNGDDKSVLIEILEDI